VHLNQGRVISATITGVPSSFSSLGAEAHTSGLGHHIFTAFRIQGVSLLVFLRQSLLLSSVQIVQALAASIHIFSRLSLDRFALEEHLQDPYDTLLGLLALTPNIMKQLG